MRRENPTAVRVNVDLLTEQQQAEVEDAFTRYQMPFFRDQNISFDDQIRFASLFCRLGRHVGAQTISKPTYHPLVRRSHYYVTSQRISGESWHSDQSRAPMPP
jgi:taurine dioxygenase